MSSTFGNLFQNSFSIFSKKFFLNYFMIFCGNFPSKFIKSIFWISFRNSVVNSHRKSLGDFIENVFVNLYANSLENFFGSFFRISFGNRLGNSIVRLLRLFFWKSLLLCEVFLRKREKFLYWFRLRISEEIVWEIAQTNSLEKKLKEIFY